MKDMYCKYDSEAFLLSGWVFLLVRYNFLLKYATGCCVYLCVVCVCVGGGGGGGGGEAWWPSGQDMS